MLWDRGEGDGWAHHVTTDPPAGTPPHRVLLHVAVGDWQVTTYQADVLARTIGASAHKPAFAPGRSLERVPLFGIPAITRNPFAGSAIVYWDNGENGAGAAREQGAARGQGSPLASAQHPRRAAPEGRVPAHRQRRRRVRRPAVPVGGGDALGREVAAPERQHPERGQRRGDRAEPRERRGG